MYDKVVSSDKHKHLRDVRFWESVIEVLGILIRVEDERKFVFKHGVKGIDYQMLQYGLIEDGFLYSYGVVVSGKKKEAQLKTAAAA